MIQQETLNQKELTVFINEELYENIYCEVFNKRYLQYRRVSFTGSGPVMVPMGLSRIRISLTSGLEKEHLDRTLEVLESTGKKLGI